MPTITTRVPVAALRGERIAEFSDSRGRGGLISLREAKHALVLEVYRAEGVEVRGAALPRIRFIVDTYTSARNRSGNCYHWSRITSTLTGKSLALSNVGGEQNTAYDVRKALGDTPDAWAAVVSSQHVIPRKYWSPPKEARYSGDVTAADILALERWP